MSERKELGPLPISPRNRFAKIDDRQRTKMGQGTPRKEIKNNMDTNKVLDRLVDDPSLEETVKRLTEIVMEALDKFPPEERKKRIQAYLMQEQHGHA